MILSLPFFYEKPYIYRQPTRWLMHKKHKPSQQINGIAMDSDKSILAKRPYKGASTRSTSSFGLLEESKADKPSNLSIKKGKRTTHRTRSKHSLKSSTTPKMHHLLFHLLPQSLYLGRFFQFMEDPIESLHRKDKEQNRIFAVATSFQVREERTCTKKVRG